MATAAAEILAAEEVTHEERMRRELSLQVGDYVYLESDSRKDLGTVSKIEGGRLFVTWHRAHRTWIYPSASLVLIAGE